MLVEPPDAEPLVDGVLVEPPAAESFFVASLDEEVLLEEDGGVALESFLDMSTDAEPDVELEPAGELGVVEPADDEELGGVVRETVLSFLSQPVSNPAPSARDTATVRVESLMCGPPWVGVKDREQGLGPSR